MAIDAIGDLGDPTKDVAAIEPVLDKETESVIDGVTAKVMPALQAALSGALDGLVITITISRKP